MSIFNWLKTPISLINKEIFPALYIRSINTGNPAFHEIENAEVFSPETEIVVEEVAEEKTGRKIHPIETCLQYMESEAYKKTYGDKPVWHLYVRNFKGLRAPPTRKNCWRYGKLNKGSPCPICRDEYLTPHYLNIKLLKQFISPYGGQLLDNMKTGVCQKQQFFLAVAVRKAQNYGLLTFTVPHRLYDYSLYNKK